MKSTQSYGPLRSRHSPARAYSSPAKTLGPLVTNSPTKFGAASGPTEKWSEFVTEMMKEGVFAKDEIGFGYVTDSAKEAVDLIVPQPADGGGPTPETKRMIQNTVQ